ncbi:uncharacterized protein LOC113633899, partial [Tachysurus ichikawai]
MLFLFMVFFTLADVEAADNNIKPDQTNVFSTEGSNISLFCTYTGSAYSLHWYRHKPRSRPEFLLLIAESSKHVTPAQPPHPQLSINLNNEQDKASKKVDLIISSAAVSDSALYYCALQPTVTGNPAALYKNTVLLYTKQCFREIHLPFLGKSLFLFHDFKEFILLTQE